MRTAQDLLGVALMLVFMGATAGVAVWLPKLCKRWLPKLWERMALPATDEGVVKGLLAMGLAVGLIAGIVAVCALLVTP